MAEREGFEPSEPLRVHMISNHAHSTTLPPLRKSLKSVATPRQEEGRILPGDRRQRIAAVKQCIACFKSQGLKDQ